MKKILAALISIFVVTSNAFASDAKLFETVFETVSKEYLEKIDIQKMVENGIDGIVNMDQKLRFSKGGETLTVYYNARSVKTIVRPSNYDNLKDWSEFLVKVIDASKQASENVKTKDFEVSEYVLVSMLNNMDKDTRYYPYLEINYKQDNGTRERYFADRMIDNEILYMRLGPLNTYTKEKIIESLELNDGFKSLIIDLRGNPGGLLGEAVEIVKIFLDEGIIASSMARSDGVMRYYTAEKGDGRLVKDKPMIVLVDGDTASSAEVLAAGLNEQSIAQIVGTKTRGKGTVQKYIKLDNGGELFLTSSNFYTPSGKSVNGAGVKPNICIYGVDETEDPSFIASKDRYKFMKCKAQSRKNRAIDVEIAVEILKK